MNDPRAFQTVSSETEVKYSFKWQIFG